MSNTFTAHNVRLDDGTETAPQTGGLIADTPWLRAALLVLDTVYPNGLTGLRIADLGCLEGGYSVEFARRGMDVLGIEARAGNFENCELVRRGLSLPNLRFARDDVCNIASYGSFDAVFCCGLLYHLDRPASFIRLLSAQTRKVLILNTHFATLALNPKFRLGDIVEQDGIKGRWCHEYDEGAADIEAFKWSAWGNHRAFWALHEYIPQMLRDAGFDLIFEQFDWMGDEIAGSMATGYRATEDRGMFVGIKTAER